MQINTCVCFTIYCVRQNVDTFPPRFYCQSNEIILCPWSKVWNIPTLDSTKSRHRTSKHFPFPLHLQPSPETALFCFTELCPRIQTRLDIPSQKDPSMASNSEGQRSAHALTGPSLCRAETVQKPRHAYVENQDRDNLIAGETSSSRGVLVGG